LTTLRDRLTFDDDVRNCNEDDSDNHKQGTDYNSEGGSETARSAKRRRSGVRRSARQSRTAAGETQTKLSGSSQALFAEAMEGPKRRRNGRGNLPPDYRKTSSRMISADTNLIVRHLTQDDARQAKKVQELFDAAELRQEPVMLTHIVLCEVCWVLKSVYRFDKSQIALALQSLMDDSGFYIQERPLIEESLTAYKKHAGQFPDHLIGVTAKKSGASTTFTFDQGVAKLPNFSLLR
jgi:predicted nucleic-acid-binding protein